MLHKENIFFLSWIILASIVLIISQFLLYSKGFYTISADEAGHTLEAFQWYKGEASFFSIWLPFQKIFYGMIFNVYYDLFWIPRILSSILGLLALLSLIFLTYELFLDKITAVIVGFLGSVFSCIVIFSVLPMTEIYFFFFTIASLAFLLHWKRTKSPIFLLLLIFLSALGTTTRYEAWVFSSVIFVFIIIDIYSAGEKSSKKLLKVFLIFLVLSAFPVYWIYLSHTTTGEATKFVSSVVERYYPIGLKSEIKNNILYSFFTINLFSLNILGLLTLIYFYKKELSTKLYVQIFLITLLSFSLITFFTKAMPTHNAWRLASIWSIMLLPFTARWLKVFLSEQKLYLKYNFILFAFILLIFFNIQTKEYTEHNYMLKEDLKIGEYIEENLKFNNPESRIYIERRGWNYSSLLVTSQKPDRFITEDNFTNPVSNSDTVSNKKILEYKQSGIQYLVLTYREKLFFDSEYMQEVKRYNNWTIYELL